MPYTAWAREGYLTLTDGNVCDHDAIEKAVIDASGRYRIRELAFDRFGAGQVMTHLQGAGIEVVPYGQGFVSMNAPTKHLDVLVRSGRLVHARHPVLRWMAGNVMLEKDAADNWKPSKKRSKEKIDGIVALTMAIGRAVVAEPPPTTTAFFVPFDGPTEDGDAAESPP